MPSKKKTALLASILAAALVSVAAGTAEARHGSGGHWSGGGGHWAADTGEVGTGVAWRQGPMPFRAGITLPSGTIAIIASSPLPPTTTTTAMAMGAIG